MKIAVIGAGVSGIIFAIKRKMDHPKDEVVVFEHLDKPLKKILSTGNGKCNIGNQNPLPNDSKNAIVEHILTKYDFKAQKEFLNSLNIKTKLVNGLSYPISESAITVRNLLLQSCEQFGVQIITEIELKEYKFKGQQIELNTSNGNYIFDKLIFATGGKSSPKLGSDGSILPLLAKHGYRLNEFQPALCPVYTKEKTRLLDGTRVKAKVTLLRNSKECFIEEGEVLFKEHGLSGIVIFNASRVIACDIKSPYLFKIDLLPQISEEELAIFLKEKGRDVLLDSYLHPNLVKYINSLNIKDDKLPSLLKSLPFTFDKLYGFDFSQVSVGGIEFQDVDNTLQSKIESNVYFLGELLDYSAPCGGYNLMWAIGTALFLSEKM